MNLPSRQVANDDRLQILANPFRDDVVMNVLNVHQCTHQASAVALEQLLDSLGSADDRLWPHEYWPPVRFNLGKPFPDGVRRNRNCNR